MMFDKKKDPQEYKNLLKYKINKSVVDDFANFLVKERKKILLMRNVNIKSIMENKYKWIVNLNILKKPSYVPPLSYS